MKGYVARDRDGVLYFYQEMPVRWESKWKSKGDPLLTMKIHPQISDVTWTDEPREFEIRFVETKSNPYIKQIMDALAELPNDISLNVLKDINGRIADWIVGGGREDSDYIRQQVRYAQNVRDEYRRRERNDQ